jgi:hypothetical protein
LSQGSPPRRRFFTIAIDLVIVLLQIQRRRVQRIASRERSGESQQHRNDRHRALRVRDPPYLLARLEAMGFECACRLWADDVDAAYFDTRSANGCFTEIHGDPPHILATFANWKRSHELWTSGDPVIVPRT